MKPAVVALFLLLPASGHAQHLLRSSRGQIDLLLEIIDEGPNPKPKEKSFMEDLEDELQSVDFDGENMNDGPGTENNLWYIPIPEYKDAEKGKKPKTKKKKA